MQTGDTRDAVDGDQLVYYSHCFPSAGGAPVRIPSSPSGSRSGSSGFLVQHQQVGRQGSAGHWGNMRAQPSSTVISRIHCENRVALRAPFASK